MSILLLNMKWKHRVYCSPLCFLPSQTPYSLFSGLAPTVTWQGRHFWPPATCCWWRPSLSHGQLSALLSRAEYRTRTWPQALCIQSVCLPSSCLRRKPSAPISDCGFLPGCFLPPSERGLFQAYTENSHIVVWHLILIFFSSMMLMFLRGTGLISGCTQLSWAGNLFPQLI